MIRPPIFQSLAQWLRRRVRRLAFYALSQPLAFAG
jgi:hypothetical protein